jgi:hypothetical protein
MTGEGLPPASTIMAGFRPDETLRAAGGLTAGELMRLTASWRHLCVEVDDGA